MAILKLTIIFTVFILTLIGEHFYPFVVKTKHNIESYLKNLSLWGVNAVLSVVFILPFTAWIASFNIFDRAESSTFILLIHILLLDFWIYWWHRAMHYFDFLWRFHQIHHLDETLDSSSAVRFHFGEVFLSAIARAPIILLLSIPFKDVLIFEGILLACSLFQHANIKIPNKFEFLLSKIIVTPSIHWIHHHADKVDMHKHFCLFLSIWDKIFGTSSKTIRTEELKIGLPKQQDKSLFNLLLLPFRHFR